MTKLSNYLNTMEKVTEMKNTESDGCSNVQDSYVGKKREIIELTIEQIDTVKKRIHGVLEVYNSSKATLKETQLVVIEQLYIELEDIESIFWSPNHDVKHTPQIRFVRDLHGEVFGALRRGIHEIINK